MGMGSMNTRMVLSLGASALLLGGTMVGCAGHGDAIASASDRNAEAASRTAAQDAGRASKALRRHQPAQAVVDAEAAVALQPRNADYRMLLGQSYMQSGRFASARDALTDALSLAGDNGATAGKAALNLALAQIATGDWSAARATIEQHGAGIAPADRGLAMALAGDPAGGVAVLNAAARSGDATPTVRQNLALAYAVAGQWQAARLVASADMSPADVDARMEQWAAFAHPASASDQVASLLGVRPVEDAGQPVALALNAAVPPVAVVAPAPVQTAELSPDVAPPPAELAAAAPAPSEVAPSEPVLPAHGPVLAAQEVPPPVRVRSLAPVQRTRPAAATIRADARPIKVAMAAVPARGTVRPAARSVVPAKGSWFVQLGAYDSPGVARDAWNRARRRLPALAGTGPNGTSITTKAGQFYRLSVGGYARTDAVGLCQRFRTAGGQCFVRAGAGDQMAQWVAKPGVRLAAKRPAVQVASR
jgi:Flp pilus assembly protein TadD